MENQSQHLKDERGQMGSDEMSLGMDHPDFGVAGDDSRSEVEQHKRVQDAADKSPQVKQLRSYQAAADSSPQIMQLKAMQGNVSAGQGGAVQRKITTGGKEFPTTWKGIARAGDPSLTAAGQAAWDALVASIGSGVNLIKLEQCWNKVAKDPKKTFDLPTDQGKLITEIKNRYQRSMKSQKDYLGRHGDASAIGAEVAEVDDSYEFKSGARNSMVTSSDMAEVGYDDLDHSGQERFATHVSTMVMHEHKGGEESQGALRRDGMGMHLSTNKDGVNRDLAGKFQIAADLKTHAAILAQSLGLESMSREEAMRNRVIRHALKLYDRIHKYLASDAPISVPADVGKEMDGVHAEIRIEQDPAFKIATHFAPTGTKLPCMGCFLYFMGQKIPIGHFHGPMWVTNAALSQQLQELLKQGVKMGKIGGKRSKELGEEIAGQARKRSKRARMAHSKQKSGKYTTDNNPDSESEMDEDTYRSVKKRALARAKGRPLSPVWESMDEFQVGGDSDDESKGSLSDGDEDDFEFDGDFDFGGGADFGGDFDFGGDSGFGGDFGSFGGDSFGGAGFGAGGFDSGSESKEAGFSGKGASAPSSINIASESGIDAAITMSVESFITDNGFHTDRQVFVVSGSQWTCYIRAVLHHFGKIDKYDAVISALSSGMNDVNLSDGVIVGSDQEDSVQEAIEAAIGTQYHAYVTDASHGHASQSRDTHGTQVPLLRTGVHFSLLR